jgi:hypothetical protein
LQIRGDDQDDQRDVQLLELADVHAVHVASTDLKKQTLKQRGDAIAAAIQARRSVNVVDTGFGEREVKPR